jgi:hypothetical protein
MGDGNAASISLKIIVIGPLEAVVPQRLHTTGIESPQGLWQFPSVSQ